MTNQQDIIYRDKVLKGDANAFSYFVDTYQQLAYTIAIRIVKNREEAEDIVQEAFLKCFHSLAGFKGESKFSTWLYRIVYHSALDRVRKQDREPATGIIGEQHRFMVDEVDNALDLMMKKERELLMKSALQTLTAEEQTIVMLYYYDELSLKEIAEVVSLSTSNIKIKLFRARKRLFTVLEQKLEWVK